MRWHILQILNYPVQNAWRDLLTNMPQPPENQTCMSTANVKICNAMFKQLQNCPPKINISQRQFGQWPFAWCGFPLNTYHFLWKIRHKHFVSSSQETHFGCHYELYSTWHNIQLSNNIQVLYVSGKMIEMHGDAASGKKTHWGSHYLLFMVPIKPPTASTV